MMLYVILTIVITTTQFVDKAEAYSAFNGGSQKIADLVNAERAKYGINPVKFYRYAPIQQAARIRAGELPVAFSHTRPNGGDFSTALDQARVNYDLAGENIGKGTSMSPESAMNQWMNSVGHRANILNPDYNLMAVGCIYSDNQNVFQWVLLLVHSDEADRDFVSLLPEYASDIGQIMYIQGMSISEYINECASELRELKQKIDSGQANADDYIQMGQVSAELGDTLGARKCYKHVLSIDPYSAEACMGMASTYDENYDNDEMLKWNLKAESLGSTDGALYANIAECYLKKNDKQSTMFYIEKAEKLSPDDEHVKSIREHINRAMNYK